MVTRTVQLIGIIDNLNNTKFHAIKTFLLKFHNFVKCCVVQDIFNKIVGIYWTVKTWRKYRTWQESCICSLSREEVSAVWVAHSVQFECWDEVGRKQLTTICNVHLRFCIIVAESCWPPQLDVFRVIIEYEVAFLFQFTVEVHNVMVDEVSDQHMTFIEQSQVTRSLSFTESSQFFATSVHLNHLHMQSSAQTDGHETYAIVSKVVPYSTTSERCAHSWSQFLGS